MPFVAGMMLQPGSTAYGAVRPEPVLDEATKSHRQMPGLWYAGDIVEDSYGGRVFANGACLVRHRGRLTLGLLWVCNVCAHSQPLKAARGRELLAGYTLPAYKVLSSG